MLIALCRSNAFAIVDEDNIKAAHKTASSTTTPTTTTLKKQKTKKAFRRRQQGDHILERPKTSETQWPKSWDQKKVIKLAAALSTLSAWAERGFSYTVARDTTTAAQASQS